MVVRTAHLRAGGGSVRWDLADRDASPGARREGVRLQDDSAIAHDSRFDGIMTGGASCVRARQAANPGRQAANSNGCSVNVTPCSWMPTIITSEGQQQSFGMDGEFRTQYTALWKPRRLIGRSSCPINPASIPFGQFMSRRAKYRHGGISSLWVCAGCLKVFPRKELCSDPRNGQTAKSRTAWPHP